MKIIYKYTVSLLKKVDSLSCKLKYTIFLQVLNNSWHCEWHIICVESMYVHILCDACF